MPKITQTIYDRMDQAVYSARGDEWWQPDSAFYQMRVFLNPVRVAYARRVLIDDAKLDPEATAVLDVGCGGGFLTEEIARMGFDTTGIDPAARSVEAAAAHARESGPTEAHAARGCRPGALLGNTVGGRDRGNSRSRFGGWIRGGKRRRSRSRRGSCLCFGEG